MSLILDKLDSLIGPNPRWGTLKELLEIALPEWQTWTPTEFSGSGSMTWSSVTVQNARYAQIGNVVVLSCTIFGTTGGSASSNLIVEGLPVEAGGPGDIWAGAGVVDGGAFSSGAVRPRGDDLTFRKFDGSAFGIGSVRGGSCLIAYEAA
jgi:hypothetical protein